MKTTRELFLSPVGPPSDQERDNEDFTPSTNILSTRIKSSSSKHDFNVADRLFHLVSNTRVLIKQKTLSERVHVPSRYYSYFLFYIPC